MTEAAPGYSPPQYVSPYGGVDAGLPDRLAAWSAKFRTPNPNTPFFGGLVADLEAAMRLLNVREYAEWLVQHGDAEQHRWGSEMLDVLDDNDASEQAFADIERVVPVATDQPYAEAVEAVAKKAVQFDLVCAVLEQVGAISGDGEENDVPALIRALLS